MSTKLIRGLSRSVAFGLALLVAGAAGAANLNLITSETSYDAEPSVSPDGQTIAYVSDVPGANSIYVVDILGGTPTQVTQSSSSESGPEWSADGTRLIFASDRSGTWDIWSVLASGLENTPIQLTNEAGDELAPAFSPVDNSLAYVGDTLDQPSVFLIPQGDIVPTQVSGETWYDLDPVFSPDGSQIAYSSARNGTFDLFLFTIGDSIGSESPITNESEYNAVSPRFSADGSLLYFTLASGTATDYLNGNSVNESVYTVPVSGGAIEPFLTNGPVKYRDPAPSPINGNVLAFAATENESGYTSDTDYNIWTTIQPAVLAQAPDSFRMWHVPPSASVSAATRVTEVAIEDAWDLGGFEFKWNYSGAPVSIAALGDVTLGGFPGSTGRSVFPLGPAIDNTAGITTYGAFSLGLDPGPNGNGLIATVIWSSTPVSQVTTGLISLQDEKILNVAGDLQPSGLTGVVTATVCHYADRDCDNDVDIVDVQMVAFLFNTSEGDALYNRDLDVDLDGDIDIVDIQTVAFLFNTNAPLPTSAPSGTASVKPAWYGAGVEYGPVDVFIEPDVKNVDPAEVFALNVRIANVDNLGAFQITLNYDPAVVHVNSFAQGSFLTGRLFFDAGTTINNTNGTATYGVFSLGATPPGPAGDGIIAVVNLTAQGNGSTAVTLSNVQVTAPDGTTQTINSLTGGTVNVGSTDTPTPTAAPTDTPTPVPTNTPTNTPVATSTPTNTPAPTNTPTAVPTNTPTNTPAPTNTPTNTPVPTNTPTPTPTVVAQVFPVPTNTSVNEGGVAFSVNIQINNAVDLGAFQFDVLYDPTKFTVSNVVLGPFPGSTGRTFLSAGLTIDNTLGKVTYGAFSLGATPAGASGSGIIATVQCMSVGAGVSPFDLDNVQVTSVSGVSQPVNASDGTVTVNAHTPTPVPTNTPTPVPTDTPTPVPTDTPTPVPTNTPTPIPTDTPTPVPTDTPTPVPTDTPTPVPTDTPTPIPTDTPTPVPTDTPTPVPTDTPTPVPTDTPTPVPTDTPTPVPTDTPTPVPTDTPTPVPTNTPTNTPVPTNTPTNTPVPTSTPTPTPTVVAQVFPVPTNTSVNEGGVAFNVDIQINNAVDLGSFQFDVLFDPAKFTVTNVVIGPFPGSTGRVFLTAGLNIDNTLGKVTYGAFSLGATPAGANGSGIIATVQCVSGEAGVSPFDLDNVQVTSVAGVPQPVSASDGTVTVNANTPTPVPTDTPTPVPTDTPTPVPTDTPTPVPTDTPTPVPTDTPTPVPTDTPTPVPTDTPTPVPTDTPTPVPTDTPTPVPTDTPTPVPTDTPTPVPTDTPTPVPTDTPTPVPTDTPTPVPTDTPTPVPTDTPTPVPTDTPTPVPTDTPTPVPTDTPTPVPTDTPTPVPTDTPTPVPTNTPTPVPTSTPTPPVLADCDDFEDGDNDGWVEHSGNWTVVGGSLDGNIAGAETVQLTTWTGRTAEEGSIETSLEMLSDGIFQNGHVVFAFKNPNDFFFAGAWAGSDKWVIGHYNGSFVALASANKPIVADVAYALRVEVSDLADSIALYVNGLLTVTLNTAADLSGGVGVTQLRSHTRWAYYCVDSEDLATPTPVPTDTPTPLPTATPTPTFPVPFCDDFNDGDANGWLVDSGLWEVVDFAYYGGPDGVTDRSVTHLDGSLTQNKVITVDVVDTNLGPFNNLHVLFGYESAGNFYFAGTWIQSKKWVIGQAVNGVLVNGNSVVDGTINPGLSGEVRVVVDGNSVSLYFDGNLKVSHVFPNVAEGEAGLMTVRAVSGFDNFCIEDLLIPVKPQM